MPYVYVLSNEAMPGLVKIGMTERDDVQTRLAELYSTGVPVPFYLEYACRVDDPCPVEEALHIAFSPQRVNSKREFFRIDPGQAIAILKLLDRAVDVTAQTQAQATEIDPESIAALEVLRRRRPRFDFHEMGIPLGATLLFDDGKTTVEVVGPRKVKLGDEELSLTACTQRLKATDRPLQPSPYWTYQGKTLREFYEETYTLDGD